jgi:hypothetical protein
MQTFAPSANIYECGQVLDRARLGKQRVETLQLIRCNLDVSLGWRNHPAAKMWANNIGGLIAYGVTICDSWIARGYKDTCREKIIAFGKPDFSDMPTWWGDERVHSSHRSNLLRKDPTYYSQFGWEENLDIPYFWPSSEIVLQA